jgi:TetR/AcrR family tetracycline transcriptional repressor
MARRRNIFLTPEKILVAAFELLDDIGLDGLTMRALAKRLDVQAPALYPHVESKAELIAIMSEQFLQEARRDLEHCESPAEWLEQFGLRFYEVLVNSRDAAMLFAIARQPSRTEQESTEALALPLMSRGYSLERAIQVESAVVSLALGSALDRTNEELSRLLSEFFDLTENFKNALHILVTGLTKD